MTAGILSRFEDTPEFYPGTTKQITVNKRRKAKDLSTWDAKPQVFKVAGVDREFFTIGNLAQALGRRPVTVRAWESKGVIPKATFRRPSEDPRGTRRLYTREQIEGIVRIAEEEGLLKGDNRSITQTDFSRRVIALFKELAVQ